MLPAVVRAADAVAPGAAWAWDDRAGNISLEGEVGNKAAADAAFAEAAHVVRLDTWINRVTGTPMEPRTAIGFIDEKGRYTIWAGTGGGVVRERQVLAGVAGRAGRAMPRAVRRHGRQFRHAQHLLSGICGAALGGEEDRPAGEALCRPQRMLSSVTIKAATSPSPPNWRSTRTAISSPCAAATSAISAPTPCISRRCARVSASCRGSTSIPAVHFHAARAVMTNTVPTNALSQRRPARGDLRYRRLLDLAARSMHGFDPAERCGGAISSRRDAFPYTNGVGITGDNGEYARGPRRGAAPRATSEGFAKRKAGPQRARQAARHRHRQLHRGRRGKARRARARGGDDQPAETRRAGARHDE